MERCCSLTVIFCSRPRATTQLGAGTMTDLAKLLACDTKRVYSESADEEDAFTASDAF